jgi:hypothetical protein
LGHEGWKSKEELGLIGALAEAWCNYVSLVFSGFIRLREDEDSLCWSKNMNNGEFTAKLGYNTQMETLNT